MAGADEPRVVRSYQRIFRPDRRIYQVDGRALPIPGGVPLRWLGWALATLLCGLALAGGSRLLTLLLAAGAAGVAVWARRPRLIPALSAGAVLGAVVAGEMLRSLDWPLRLVVVPAVVATVMTQVTPDGRPVHRFAWSWLRAHVAGRRSLGRALPPAGRSRATGAGVRVLCDEHGPVLRRARITGPAVVAFRAPVAVRRGRRGVRVWPLRRRPRGLVMDQVTVGERERLEVHR